MLIPHFKNTKILRSLRFQISKIAKFIFFYFNLSKHLVFSFQNLNKCYFWLLNLVKLVFDFKIVKRCFWFLELVKLYFLYLRISKLPLLTFKI